MAQSTVCAVGTLGLAVEHRGTQYAVSAQHVLQPFDEHVLPVGTNWLSVPAPYDVNERCVRDQPRGQTLQVSPDGAPVKTANLIHTGVDAAMIELAQRITNDGTVMGIGAPNVSAPLGGDGVCAEPF